MRAAGIFRVGQRPKIRAAEPREKTLFARADDEDMTETENRARKVSGKQGIILVLVKYRARPFHDFFLWVSLHEFVEGHFTLRDFFFCFFPTSPSPITFPIVRPYQIKANNVRKTCNVVYLWYPTL